MSVCVGEEEAKARLVAAAPELLEALKDMVLWVSAFTYGQGAKAHDEATTSPRMRKAVELISKSTGGNSYRCLFIDKTDR